VHQKLSKYFFYLLIILCGFSTVSAQEIDLNKKGISAEEVQSLAMEIADEYIAGIGEAIYLFARDPRVDPNSRVLIQSFLRNGVGAALDIGASNNPNVAILDLLVLSSLQSWAFEKNWSRAGIDPGLVKDVLNRLKQAEKDTWYLSSRVLNDNQQNTLRELIKAWIQANPDRTVVSLVRFSDFTDARRLPDEGHRNTAQGLLLNLNDVTRTVDQARLLGERALWFAGRYPYVLGEQSELSLYRMLSQPDIQQVMTALSSLQQLSDSTVNEAESALNRVTDNAFDRFRKESSAVFSEFDTRQESLINTVRELHSAIEASTVLSQEVTRTAKEFDQVLMRFQSIPDSDRKPILITDIRDAARESADAAEQLTLLLKQTNDLIESNHFNNAITDINEVADSWADKFFWRGLLLIAILLIGLLLIKLVPVKTR